MKAKFIILATLTTSNFIMPETANADNYISDYAISIAGFNIGKSSFKTTIENNTYKISGSLKASGVASLFTSLKGNLTANGQLGADKINPLSFDVSYTEGKKAKRTTIQFDGRKVIKTTNQPTVKKKGQWVELTPAMLRNVVDPIASMLIPAKNLRSVCNKKIKMFDGAMRVDFPMRYIRTIPFSAKGYKGDVVTCRAAFRPRGGYDAQKRDIIWMRKNGYLDVSFAPVGSTGFYAPVKAKVKLRVGTATIRARRFQILTE